VLVRAALSECRYPGEDAEGTDVVARLRQKQCEQSTQVGAGAGHRREVWRGAVG
jgi:hypothetical protein